MNKETFDELLKKHNEIRDRIMNKSKQIVKLREQIQDLHGEILNEEKPLDFINGEINKWAIVHHTTNRQELSLFQLKQHLKYSLKRKE